MIDYCKCVHSVLIVKCGDCEKEVRTYEQGKKDGIEKCLTILNKMNPNSKILWALKKHLERVSNND